MRNLASIQQILALEPIENADSIERARVLGWWVVVKKGEFKVGDLVVYCEIDSLLPERPEFEFLRKSAYLAPRDGMPGGFRVKTIKLRGQVSQGICFPLSIIPVSATTNEPHRLAIIGQDVTADLGIVKYEPPQPAGLLGTISGKFPCWLPRTDETRVQVLENLLERYRGREFYVTEKIDGTSFTAFLKNGEFGVCSRNNRWDLGDERCLYVEVAKKLLIESRLREYHQRYGTELAIQGEIIGPSIQKNKYARSQHELHIFTVMDCSTSDDLSIDDATEVVHRLGMHFVPVVERQITLSHTVDQLIEMADGVSTLHNTLREGLVFRPLVPGRDIETGRLSFKAINPKFLLKYDE